MPSTSSRSVPDDHCDSAGPDLVSPVLQAGLNLVHRPFQCAARAQLINSRPLAVTGTARMPGLPDVTARIETQVLQSPGGGKPEEFQNMVRNELALYAKIINEANIRLTP